MRFILLSAILMLAACGGGGGGDSGGTATTPAPIQLGSRQVPGWQLSATALKAATGGNDWQVTVRLEPEVGQPAAQEVRFWLDGNNEQAGVVAAQVPGDPQAWTLTLAVPTGSRVLWARVTDVDGNMVEAGEECFSVTALTP